MKHYWAYGQNLRTDEDFDGLLARSAGPADVHYIVSRGEAPVAFPQTEAIYRSVYPDADGAPSLLIWRNSDHYRIRWSDVALYDLSADSISCFPSPGVGPGVLAIQLLGAVMSMRLEMAGTRALHASGVVVRDHGVAFLSGSGSGKSTLAASLMQVGCALLADDILPVRRCGCGFSGGSGYPQLRLWPAEVDHFVGDYQQLELVHPDVAKRRVPVGAPGFGTFCNDAKPLACIYRPRRRSAGDLRDDIEITPISPRDAVVELVRHSFLVYLVQSLGWQPERLDFFARLVCEVPMRRLVYPSALGRLSDVREAILADLETLY